MNSGRTERLTGWIDNRRRPLINLRTHDKTYRALIDTGFNGYLLWECRTSNLSDFPGELTSLYDTVEVAGGKTIVRVGAVLIQWFQDRQNAFTRVDALVAFVPRSPDSDAPTAYVGNALLSGMMLFIDFLNATLRIERSK